MADQGSGLFILDGTTGLVFRARHSEGVWMPEPMSSDVFVIALVMSTIEAVHEEGVGGSKM